MKIILGASQYSKTTMSRSQQNFFTFTILAGAANSQYTSLFQAYAASLAFYTSTGEPRLTWHPQDSHESHAPSQSGAHLKKRVAKCPMSKWHPARSWFHHTLLTSYDFRYLSVSPGTLGSQDSLAYCIAATSKKPCERLVFAGAYILTVH